MSLPLHNGALAVLEMQFPGKIMQGVKGCVEGGGRESKLGGGGWVRHVYLALMFEK